MKQEAELKAAQYLSSAVVAVIPAYNEEKFIGQTVREARKYAGEVIVVDDGSYDRTAEIACGSGAQVLKHNANRGYGDAIKTCIKAALHTRAQVAVTIDGDGQHNPGEIPAVASPVLEGRADIVIGSRFLGSKTNLPAYRRFGIKVITILYNLGSKSWISDAQSGFRAYSRKALEALRPLDRGMGISVELILEARDKDLKIHEVPISCLFHEHSSTINPVRHGLSVTVLVLKLRAKRFIYRLLGKRLIKRQEN